MRYFYAVVLLIASAAASVAATWDGKRGPFDVMTYSSPGHIPGLPGGSGVAYTVIRVECSDPTISGVRLKFAYRDESGDHQVSMLSDVANGHAGFVTAVPAALISGLHLIELREASAY